MWKKDTEKLVSRANEQSNINKYVRLFENGEENNYKKLIRNTELAKAHEKGKIEGKLEGRLEGIELGSKEAKIEMAKKLKEAGFEISLIAEVTGLSIKEIDFLKEEA